MSASSVAKGKARSLVLDDNTHAGPASPERNRAHSQGSHAPDRRVRPQPIPATTLLNVEYPGILSTDPQLEPAAAASTSYTSLERALSTLHPSTLPPFTSSPHEALHFLSKIPNEGLKVVECRLGSFASPPPPPEPLQPYGATNSAAEHTDIDHVYRAPLLGEAVPTHNIVIRIVKRTWRQKKRKRPSSASPTPKPKEPTGSTSSDDIALDPALLAEADADPADHRSTEPSNGTDQQPRKKKQRFTGRVKKEYCVQVLGMATNTVRFRSMADFAFQPNVSASTSSQPDSATHLDPVMALHKALATMDLEALQNFRIPEQLEDYQIPNPSAGPDAPLQSNLHMVPPAYFSRMDVPFHYGFQQTPYSELRTISTPAHLAMPSKGASFAHALKRTDLVGGQMQRFVNRVRLSNIAPQPFRVGRDAKVPTKPLADVVRIEHRCEPKVLARLRALLVERPVWSRVALKNQLTDEELREVQGNNEKVYYALVGYSMVGGPWRDTIVRFGYDVRRDNSSRIYQRIFLRGGPMNRESRISIQGVQGRPTGDEGGGELEDDEDVSLGVARSSVVALGGGEGGVERSTSTHMFDGVSLHRNVGNFQLCDIDDPLIKPLIWRTNDEQLGQHFVLQLEPMGTEWLRHSYDVETGWYTRRALELIRALVTSRFKSLAETGKPLDPQAVHAIVHKTKHKWQQEDTSPPQSNPSKAKTPRTAQEPAWPPESNQDTNSPHIDPALT